MRRNQQFELIDRHAVQHGVMDRNHPMAARLLHPSGARDAVQAQDLGDSSPLPRLDQAEQSVVRRLPFDGQGRRQCIQRTIAHLARWSTVRLKVNRRPDTFLALRAWKTDENTKRAPRAGAGLP